MKTLKIILILLAIVGVILLIRLYLNSKHNHNVGASYLIHGTNIKVGMSERQVRQIMQSEKQPDDLQPRQVPLGMINDSTDAYQLIFPGTEEDGDIKITFDSKTNRVIQIYYGKTY